MHVCASAPADYLVALPINHAVDASMTLVAATVAVPLTVTVTLKPVDLPGNYIVTYIPLLV